MRIIKIKRCEDCPYSEIILKTEDLEKKKISEHFSIITKQRHYIDCYCNESDGKYCGESKDSVPVWCPLEEIGE